MIEGQIDGRDMIYRDEIGAELTDSDKMKIFT